MVGARPSRSSPLTEPEKHTRLLPNRDQSLNLSILGLVFPYRKVSYCAKHGQKAKKIAQTLGMQHKRQASKPALSEVEGKERVEKSLLSKVNIDLIA